MLFHGEQGAMFGPGGTVTATDPLGVVAPAVWGYVTWTENQIVVVSESGTLKRVQPMYLLTASFDCIGSGSRIIQVQNSGRFSQNSSLFTYDRKSPAQFGSTFTGVRFRLAPSISELVPLAAFSGSLVTVFGASFGASGTVRFGLHSIDGSSNSSGRWGHTSICWYLVGLAMFFCRPFGSANLFVMDVDYFCRSGRGSLGCCHC